MSNDDFLFGLGDSSSSYHTLQQGSSMSSSGTTHPHHKTSFLKSLTNLARPSNELKRTQSSSSTVSVNDHSPRLESGIVVGASHSHLDIINQDSHANSRSTSPDRWGMTPSTLSNSHKSPVKNKLFVPPKRLGRHTRLDDDNDWNDDIDNISSPVTPKIKEVQFYPDLKNLKITSTDTLTNSVPSHNNRSKVSIGSGSPVDEEHEREAVNEENEEEDSLYPFLKTDYEQIMKDPFKLLITQAPPPNDSSRYNKIVKALTKPHFDMNELRKQSWSGIPKSIRALVWQVLLGYLPANSSTRESVLSRKRKEYSNSMSQLFRGEKDQAVWHQITIDIPRTNPSVKLYSYETTQRSLEKILYLWAIRHPASGYVQGINDLATPFYQVFLNHYLKDSIDVETFDPKVVPKELMNCIEADIYWCLTKVLDTIQDNYIHEQPGIIRQVTELKNLVKRDEPFLSQHFENEGIDFIQFSFRWMNCMLMRELRIELIIRMWDTYISNYPTGFNQFHVYVCCAFLRRFSDTLLDMDFQDMIMFLQDSSKTKDWNHEDVEMMLSEAFVWQSLYENATAHLK